MLNKILADLKVSDWKIDHQNRYITGSLHLKKLLNINTDRLSITQFNQLIREDYRNADLLNDSWLISCNDLTIPLVLGNYQVWVRFKSLGFENNDKNIEIGYMQWISEPEKISLQKIDVPDLNQSLDPDGKSVSVYDHEYQKMVQKVKTDQLQLQNLYNNMPLGYLRLQILWDENNEIVDYLVLETNKTSAAIFEIPSEKHSGMKGSEFSDEFCEDLVLLRELYHTKSHTEIEQLINGKKYCHIIMYMVGNDQVVCLLSDITESHAMHEELDRSEKILRNIYDNLPVGIELYDSKGNLIDLNIKDIEMFGILNKEDVIGLNLFDNTHIPVEVLEQLREEQPTSYRINYSFTDHRNAYVSRRTDSMEIFTKVNILRDKKGRICNYLFINIDNTEISQAYQRIAEFESSFSLISRYGKIGYCKFDLLTREGSGVPQWYLNLGEEPDTPLSQVIGVYNHVNEEDKQKLFGHIKRLKSGEIIGFTEDLRVLHKDNSWSWTQVNVLKNPDNTDDSKLEMLCVNFDITHLKETEEMLIKAKEKAEVSDKIKSAFLANMSHEIRTPLNAIVGFTELLIETDEKEEKETYATIVRENNEMLLQLISDILDLSKIEAGTLEFIYGEVDLNRLCREIVQTYEVKASSQVKIILGKQLSSCHLISDKNRLMQIIGNFMNNALKFTSSGSITLGYQVLDKERIKIFVRDTGCGIPQEMQESVFHRFVKLNNFIQGTGLGLPICSSIVKQMGGEIGVDSKPGMGSCFWFILPFSSDKNEELDLILPTSPQLEKTCTKEKTVVLVAEDTESNFLLIKNIIKNRYTLIHAQNGLIALDMLSKTKVDLVLMDINMPEMDGLEATRQIRRKGLQLPIIAVTAYAYDGDKQKALDAGCSDYVSKPIKPKELLSMIEDYLK